jgi:transcription-repair coupling factor (superfamily II helicase)
MSPETGQGPQIERLTEAVAGGERVITLSGLTSVASKAYVLAALRARTGLSFVVVTDSNGSLDAWNTDLLFWSQNLTDGSNGMDAAGPSNIVALPSFESDVYSGLSPHAETHERRALSLWQAAHGDAAFLIVSARSLITRTVTPAEIRAAGARLALDDEMPPGDLIALLASAGYVREDPLFNIGQFSARGGIVDVWSPDAAAPVRIEFFGDTIDSIRAFDPDTQLSTGKLSRVSLAPMREITASETDFRDWAFFARERFAAPEFARTLQDRTDLADAGESFSGWEFLLPLSHPAKGSAFDYFGDSVLVIDEPAVIEGTVRSFYSSAAARFARITDAGDIGLRPEELFLDGAELRSALEERRLVELRSLGKIAGQTDEDFTLPLSVRCSCFRPRPATRNSTSRRAQRKSFTVRSAN